MNQTVKSASRPYAIVLGMDANGLGVARSLGRHGVPIIGMDPRPNLPGSRSKYISFQICADPQESPDRLLQELISYGERHGKGILYPTNDTFVSLMSRHRVELARSLDFNMPPERVIETIIDKRMQYQEASRLGVAIPKTYYPSTMEELEAEIANIEYPAFIKPCLSNEFYRKFQSKGLLVNDSQELREGFRKILPTGIKMIVQEFVAGPSSNMFSMATYVSRDGMIAPPCVWQKLRQSPVDFGVGTFVRIVDEPRIVEQGIRFLKGIGFTGIGEIEYKWDERANEFKLIELNARPWLQNSLSAYAGLDTSYLQYLDLTGSPSLEMRPCQKDIRWLDLLSDLSTFWTLRERGELSTLEWVRSCLGAEVHAYAALDDVRPMLSRYNYGLDLIKMLVFLLKGEA